ncbi:MAG: hypothetical protein ACJ76B_11780 [Solirubrobacterales bacterium]
MASPAGTIDRAAGTFGRSVFAFTLASVGAVLLFWAAAGAAQAATSYSYQGESGNGSLGVAPTDAAVDDGTGNLLVVDAPNNRVVVFESTQPGASIIATFGEGEFSSPYGIAIDQSNGDVYVSDAGNDRIVRYTSVGGTPPTYTLDGTYSSPAKGTGAEEVGNFASTLAMDPANGDLLIADTGNLRVERFDSSGAFVDSFDGSDSDAGAFTSLLDISTGPDSAIYLIANGSVEPELGFVSGSVVDEFADDGTFIETLAPGQLDNARAIGYDAHLDNVLVTSGGSFIEGRNIALRAIHEGQLIGSYEIPTPQEASIAVSVAVPGTGLAPLSVLTSQTVPLAFGIATVLSVKSIGVDVTLSTPSAIGGSEAHLSGTVDPHGDSGSAHFEYRRVGINDWTSTPDQPVAGEGPQPVEENLTGLLANQLYEARLSANVSGFTETSEPQQFKTISVAPAATTGEAVEIGATAATLTGRVNPNGTATTWFFEYGPTEAYGARIPLISAPAGSGQELLGFSRQISELVAGTTYHFRIVAENSAGATEGADETFVAGSVSPEGRGYELVSGNLHGAAIDQQFGALALSAGMSFSAKPVASEAQASPYNPRLFSKRGANDWEPAAYVDPPIMQNGRRVFNTTLGISDDGNWALVVSNKKLTPDAEEGQQVGNLYMKDLRSGDLDLVGTSPFGLFDLTNAGADPQPFFAGASNFDWVVFEAPPLLEGVTSNAIYRWSRDDGLEVMSTLPGGNVPTAPTLTTEYNLIVKRYVSADGSSLEFGLLANHPLGPVYVRAGDETIPISVSELNGELKNGFPFGISADGRYAFFTAEGQLTSDAAESQRSMYRYDLETDTLEYVDEIYGDNNSFNFNANVYDISADGTSLAYKAAVPGNPNDGRLSVWHEGEVQTLAQVGGTEAFWTAQFSPDGRYFAYSDAAAPFVGASPPDIYGDVYLYDLETTNLSCASCDGDDPTDSSYLPLGEKIINNRLPQVVDDNGRVFFGSEDNLVPGDSNGELDVYVFQAGRLSLISPGTEAFPALLMDISKDGRDVYFSTPQSLVLRDVDAEVDIYDARVGGGLPAQNILPPPLCSGEACQGLGTDSPATPGVGSEVITGTAAKAKPKKHGCKKGKVRRKGRCVKPKAKRPKAQGPRSHRSRGSR